MLKIKIVANDYRNAEKLAEHVNEVLSKISRNQYVDMKVTGTGDVIILYNDEDLVQL